MEDDAGSEAVTDGGTPPSTPLAPDRPVVDGTQKSSEEIRAEMQQLLDEDTRRADEPPAGPASPAGASPADVAQGPVDRARAAVPEKVAAATGTVRRRPDVFAGLAVVLVAILLVRRWLSRR